MSADKLNENKTGSEGSDHPRRDDRSSSSEKYGRSQQTPKIIQDKEKDRKNPFKADEGTEKERQTILPLIPQAMRKNNSSSPEKTTQKLIKGSAKSPAPFYQQDRTLCSFGGSSFGQTRLSKLNEIQAQQYKDMEKVLSEKELKNIKMRFQLSKMLIEQPLEVGDDALEQGGDEADDPKSPSSLELMMSPAQKDLIGKSVRYINNDKKKPVKRTVVGGVDQYKAYIKDREMEAKLKEKLSLALKKQQALIIRQRKEAELMSKNKLKKVNILDDLSKGVVRNESLRSIS